MTSRQVFIQRLKLEFAAHNARAYLGEYGYHRIDPKSRQMNELVEGVAQKMGDEVLNYYLNASDAAYWRLVTEVTQ